MYAKSLQLCPTLCNTMDCSLPGSSVHGIIQASTVEWVAMPSSKESSQPRIELKSLNKSPALQTASWPLAPSGKPRLFQSIYKKGASLVAQLVKNLPANGEDIKKHKRWGFNYWIGKITWRRKWHLLQYCCLENSMDRGAWWVGYHPWGCKELNLTQCAGTGIYKKGQVSNNFHLEKINWIQMLYRNEMINESHIWVLMHKS